MISVLWFVLGALFGSLATIAYIRQKQLNMLHKMITRMTKDMLKHGGEKDGN